MLNAGVLVLLRETSLPRAIANLSRARSSFESAYRPSGSPRLDIRENLGTENLGNPLRERLYVAGTADQSVWLVTMSDKEGYLVHFRWSKRSSTPDWVQRLERSPKEDAKPKGTLARIVWRQGFRARPPVRREAQRWLRRVTPYAGYAQSRGLGNLDLLAYFIDAKGELGSTEIFSPEPIPILGGGYRLSLKDLEGHLPVTVEEGAFLGHPLTAKGFPVSRAERATIRANWHRRPYQRGAVEGR